jgi:hypothetical protein
MARAFFINVADVGWGAVFEGEEMAFFAKRNEISGLFAMLVSRICDSGVFDIGTCPSWLILEWRRSRLVRKLGLSG